MPVSSAFKAVVEEESPRALAISLGWNCKTLKSARWDTEKLGFKELYEYLQKECRGEEPLLPEKLPAQCVDQVAVQKKAPVSIGPGMDIAHEDLVRHNLERCSCPPEYKLVEKKGQPFCQRNLALPKETP